MAFGLPINRTPAFRGSNRTAGACSPLICSSNLVTSSMMRLVASRSTSGVIGCARRSSSGTGGPAFMLMVLRGNSFGRLVYGARMYWAPHCA